MLKCYGCQRIDNINGYEDRKAINTQVLKDVYLFVPQLKAINFGISLLLEKGF